MSGPFPLPPAVLVTGGKGGVGKSTVAAGLARAMADAGWRVGMLDADLSGPSQSLLFGIDRMPLVAGRIAPRLADGVAVATLGAVAQPSTPLLWNRHTIRGALLQLVEEVDWSGVDALIVDIPPGSGDIHTGIAEMLPRLAWLVVTTGSPLALADCERCIELVRRMDGTILGVIANMTRLRCEDCGAWQNLFDAQPCDEMATKRQLPLLAHLPLDARVVKGHGLAPVVQRCSAWIGPSAPGTRDVTAGIAAPRKGDA